MDETTRQERQAKVDRLTQELSEAKSDLESAKVDERIETIQEANERFIKERQKPAEVPTPVRVKKAVK